MRRISLLRHARTEPESSTGRDFDRRLDDQGRDDAVRIGDNMRELGLVPDRIISSPAVRAVMTAELAGLTPQLDERIYEASAGDLMAILQSMEGQVQSLMLIGHNPGLGRLATILAGSAVAMAPGTLVEIELPIERWSDAGRSAGRVRRLIALSELD